MRLARLKHQVNLQQEVRTKDNLGGATVEWTSFAGPVWAELEQLSDGQRFFSGQDMTDTVYRVTIRHLPNVTEKLRVHFIHDNRVFYVTGVREVNEGGFYLELTCSSRQKEKTS